MLKYLEIAHYVIISKLRIDFRDALTVMTGETGAGKSILLDALGLILGDPPDREAIRQDCKESEFKACFEIAPDHAVWPFVQKKFKIERPANNQLTVNRVFDRKERDDITLNDVTLSVADLKLFGIFLVEIHGQFANQTFLAPETQINLLDSFGNYPGGVLERVIEAWAEIARITHMLNIERAFITTAERDRRPIETIVASVEALKLKETTYVDTVKELAELKEIRDISDMFHAANAQLVAQTGVEMSLICVDKLLANQKDPMLDEMKKNIKVSLQHARVAISEMMRLAPKYLDVDTSGIEKMESYLAQVRDLSAQHGVDPDRLYDYYIYLIERLERIRNAPQRIKELDGLLGKANDSYRKHATVLSNERKKAAVRLSEAINSEMPLLRLMSAQAQIQVLTDTNIRTERGFNQVCFMARMNPGMPFSPVAKTASGGELARLILALKMILQSVQTVTTLVLDEIDTGIGGAAAAAVGARISKLARQTQILIITHSPQVASCGNQHLHISKKTDGTSTESQVRELTQDERINEISRMLAGEELTDQSRAAAQALIDAAKRAADAAIAEPPHPALTAPPPDEAASA